VATVIKLKRSETPSQIPGSGSLEVGELAMNITDGKFYTKNSSGTVVEVGGAGSVTLQDVTTNGAITTNNITLNGSDIIFEGALENAFETTLTVIEPTGDRTISLPNKSGTVALEEVRQTFHALRRTQDGKLYYTLRDKYVGTFSNDGGVTELSSDADYVAVEEEFISGGDEIFVGDGSTVSFTLSKSYPSGSADRLAVFVNDVRKVATKDYTVSGTTLTFTSAPNLGSYVQNSQIVVKQIKKEYKNEVSDTYQQYKFEVGRNYYQLNSDGKLVKSENNDITVDEANFPDDVTDNDFASYNGASIVNPTTYSV